MPQSIKDFLKFMKKEIIQYNDKTGIANQTDPHWRLYKALILRDYIVPNFKRVKYAGYSNYNYHEFGTDSGFIKINGVLYPDTTLIPLIEGSYQKGYFNSLNFYAQKFPDIDELERRLWNFKKTATELNFHHKLFGEFVKWFADKKDNRNFTENNAHLVLLDNIKVSWDDLITLFRSSSMDILLHSTKSQLEQFSKKIQEITFDYLNPITGIANYQIQNQKYHLLCITRHKKTLEAFFRTQKKLENFEINSI